MTEQVYVMMIEELPDGTWREGPSHDCSVAEAVTLIEAGAAKAPHASRGVVPVEWAAPKKVSKKVVKEVSEEDGNDSS